MDEEEYSMFQKNELHCKLRVHYLNIMPYNYLNLVQFSPMLLTKFCHICVSKYRIIMTNNIFNMGLKVAAT